MFTRICQIAVLIIGGLIAVAGILAFPDSVLMASMMIVTVVGPLAATCAQIRRPGTTAALRIGAATTAAASATILMVAGLIALMGGAAATAIPLLLAIGGTWGWRRRRTLIAHLRSPTADHRTIPPRDVGATAHESRPRLGGRSSADGPGSGFWPSQVQPAIVTTSQLCGAWQRSYWLLLDLPPGPSRDEVVGLRRDLLDELERRDPTGFHRWLHTEPRAGSHPGHYLTADQ
jgi:hypothetical protein